MRPPRQLIFHGHRRAHGLIIGEPLSEAERRARVLAEWRPGTAVFRLEDGAYFVRWSAERSLRSTEAAGQIVAKVDGRWMTAPLANDELPENCGDLLRVRAGRIQSIRLDTPVDVSTWLDVGPLEVVEVKPLGAAPPVPEAALEAVRVDLRAAAGLPPPDPERQQALRRALRGESPSATGAWGADTPAWRRTAASWLQRIAQWLRPPPSPDASRAEGARSAATRIASPDSAPDHQPSAWRRLMDTASAWLSSTGIAWVVGAWHQRYLDRLVNMFAAGDLQEALRHAIPLGDRPSQVTALRPPSPRDSLTFSRPDEGPSRGIRGDDRTWERLRRFYRDTVDTLIAAKRYKEAAFVLAELLGEPKEAVAMLEREREAHLAAELAETAALDPALRVRLWVKAGDWPRAVRLARRHHAFAEAIAGLKGDKQGRAEKLRALWAAHRAEIGDYLGAIELLWPKQKPVQAWLDEARKLGGNVAARVLAVQLSLTPDAFEEIRGETEAILALPGAEGVEARRALADGFIAHPVAGAAVLARPLVRAMVEDGTAATADRQRINTLIKTTENTLLQADLPRGRHAGRPKRTSIALDVDEADRGALSLHDAVRLASGRMLFALGEAGVLMTTADGRALAHLKVPATRLVPSDGGHRALALIGRGHLTQVHRLDLVHWRATPWCEQPIGTFASTFDGWRWFASIGPKHHLLMLDVTGQRPQIEWDTGSPRPFAVRRGADRVAILGHRDELVTEVFDTTKLQLKSRHEIGAYEDLFPSRVLITDVEASGEVLILRPAPDSPDQAKTIEWQAVQRPSAKTRAFKAPRAEPRRLALLGDRFVVVWSTEDGCRIEGRSFATETLWLRLQLAGAQTAAVRHSDNHLLVFDDLGRAMVIDLATMTLERNLRPQL